MSRLKVILSAGLFLATFVAPAWAENVKVATYNIWFLKENISDTRAERIREVIEKLDADVIGLSEIADRAALERVFDPSDWLLVIDDDSGQTQDVALAVRKPLMVVGLNSDSDDLDADDDDFLFSQGSNNFFFPNRRDVLAVEVEEPESGTRFFVMVHHAKARSGGRPETDHRREGASRRLITLLEQRFDDEQYILLGDMNDNPDDRSLNILETGDPDALAGPEQIAGPFLMNLTEELVVQDHVSWGLTSAAVSGATINTVVPGSRSMNNTLRGADAGPFPILFDQILISASLQDEYVAGSVHILDDPVALEGTNRNNTASDHLPVSAIFDLDGDQDGDTPVPPAIAGVQIVALLPNPEGVDAGNEWVKLKNATASEVGIEGWKLRDRAGHEIVLTGTISAGEERQVSLEANELPLNNSGDEVVLTDADGGPQHRVTYTASQTGSGAIVTFGN